MEPFENAVPLLNAEKLAAIRRLEGPPPIDEGTQQVILHQLLEMVQPMLCDLVDKAVESRITTVDNGRAAMLEMIGPLLSDLVDKAVESRITTVDHGRAAMLEMVQPMLSDLVDKVVESRITTVDNGRAAMLEMIGPLLSDLVDKAVESRITTVDNGRAAMLEMVQPMLSDLVDKAVEKQNPSVSRDLGEGADNGRPIKPANSAAGLRPGPNRRALGGGKIDKDTKKILALPMVPLHHGIGLRDGLRPPRQRRALGEEREEKANNSLATTRMPTRSMKKQSSQGN